jgi:protein gp37
MADLFGRWVPAEWIEAVLDSIRANPQWNSLLLTKFPKRLAEFQFPDNA